MQTTAVDHDIKKTSGKNGISQTLPWRNEP
jgi:hypothetical protein